MAQTIADACHAVVALKGPDTVICDGAHFCLMAEGGSELAKAGTGDVLAGMVCALLAQGLDPFDAASLGCYLHAIAGHLAAQDLTDIAVLPEDVIESLPAAIRHTEGIANP